nr:ATP-binding protein [Pseudodesulfovibrio tunisiensis]
MRRTIIITVIAFLFFGSFPAGNVFAEPVLRVGFGIISPPFAFLSVKDGRKVIRGYDVDICVMLSKISGVKMRFLPIGSIRERGTLLRNDENSAIIGSKDKARKLGLAFIPAGVSLRNHLYVHKDCHTVTCLRDLKGKRVALVKDAPYDEVEVKGEIIEVNSPLEALTLLHDGAVDVFLAPAERVADYLIENHELTEVRKVGLTLARVPLGLIISTRDSDLVAQFRQGMQYLKDHGHIQRLRDKWFGKEVGGLNLSRYYRHIAAGSATILAIFAGIILWNVSLKRRVARVADDLRRTEQRYRDLIESSPDMIFLVTEAGDILHANDRALSNLSLTSPAPDLNFEDLVIADEKEDVAAFLTKVFNDGCDKYEFEVDMPDGSLLQVEVAGRIIQGSLHTELLACLFARNVTERNRMEEELIQSERLGVIGKMAASVAHEINNPLGIIQANAEDLLFAGEVDADTREGLEAIQRNAVRAGEIIRDLLDLASPKPFAEETLDLADMVHESITLLGPKLRQVELTLDLRGPLMVRGDSRALQQVVVNLLLNAQNYVQEGGEVAIAGYASAHGDDQTIRLEIRDSGKGIARENLFRVFEPFFTSRKSGFGLGLFITRRIVERHNGIIFAESEPGRGTRIIIELPAFSQN